MKKALIAGLAVVSLTVAAEAAKPKYVIQYKATQPVVLAPDQAYILYRSNVVAKTKVDLIFVRDLTPAEVEEYKAASLKAEAKRQKSRLDEVNMNRQSRGLQPLAALPPEPAGKAPLPSVPQIKNGVPNVVRAMGKDALVKGEVERTYLLQVPAGTYLIAGQSPAGMVGGTCMCMGSVKFEAKAGQVTDLGHILAAPESAVGDVPEFKGIALDPQIKVVPWVVGVRPANQTDTRPAEIANAQIAPARYTVADKFPNFFGMLVNRIPAIPGILAYDGDRPIADGGVTAPPAVPGAGS